MSTAVGIRLKKERLRFGGSVGKGANLFGQAGGSLLLSFVGEVTVDIRHWLEGIEYLESFDIDEMIGQGDTSAFYHNAQCPTPTRAL